MELPLLQNLDFRKRRALQICIVFAATMLVQFFLHFSHSGWIGFAVMMIYAGFDSGTSIHRTMHRFGGAMLGLILSWFLWAFGLLDFRIYVLMIPIIVFFAFFSLGKRYAIPTIFTVTVTVLGTGFYSPVDYQVRNLFFDYFRSTCVAFGICIFFEAIVFREKNLAHLFYLELQKDIVTKLEELLVVVSSTPLRERDYLRLSSVCNTKIVEFHEFMKMTTYDYHLQKERFTALENFNTILREAYTKIRCLFVSHPAPDDELIKQLEHQIEQLRMLLRGEKLA